LKVALNKVVHVTTQPYVIINHFRRQTYSNWANIVFYI